MTTTKDVKTTLTNCLRELRLPAFREHYEGMAQRATQETLSYEMYLLELAQRECEGRLNNRIETMLRQSRLPLEKSLESFKLKRLPTKVGRQLPTLLDGTFVDHCENLLVFGKSGTGKPQPTQYPSGNTGMRRPNYRYGSKTPAIRQDV
jgi:DNA replication protein DnaC